MTKGIFKIDDYRNRGAKVKTEKIVVTTKETLHLLGIRAKSLPWLERRAGWIPRPRRIGFTASEVKHLLKALKQSVGNHR